MHELVAYRDYVSGEPLSYWRSTSGFEVDFILGDHTGIEMKAKDTISPRDVRSLRALAEERKLKRHICVSLETRPRRVDGSQSCPCRSSSMRCGAESTCEDCCDHGAPGPMLPSGAKHDAQDHDPSSPGTPEEGRPRCQGSGTLAQRADP